MIDFGDIEATEADHAEESRAADWELRASRSAGERARPPILWKPGDKAEESQGQSGQSPRGIFYGLEFPTSASQLEALGPSWLNSAFNAAQSLPKGTNVASIRAVKWLGSRDAVSRLLLDVEYAPRKGALHNFLLVKMPLPTESSAEALTAASQPPSPSSSRMPEDWTAEINSYRLLEGAVQLGMPRYYFGDVSGSTAQFILITQWVPTPADGGWDSWVQGGVLHMDLQANNFRLWDGLVRARGAVAGACKKGHLANPEILSRALSGTEAPCEPEVADMPSDWRGVQDTDWAVRAAMAQDFVTNSAKRLFPTYTRTPEAMKNFRKVLVAGRNNAAHIDWWFGIRPDFVAVGHDRLDLDSLYLLPSATCGEAEGDQKDAATLCVRDWVGFGEGSVARKLFAWLSCADREVLRLHLGQLVGAFVEAYHESGGPLLDIALLLKHFVMAVVEQCAQLVGQMEQVYRWCPKDQWSSIKTINDERICACTSQQGSLWRFVRCFVNVAVLIQLMDIGPQLDELMGQLLSEHAVGEPMSPDNPLPAFVVVRDGAHLFAEASSTSTLISRLTVGMYIFPSPGCSAKPDPEKANVSWIQVHIPVPGWMLAKDIRRAAMQITKTEDMNKKANAEMELFSLMYHTRRQYTGSNPQGTCITSAMMLRNEVLARCKVSNVLEHLGRGPCGVYLGSFLAERVRRPWWPKGYKDWVHHSFLVFQDGTIADITADQFDQVPQLWFPAEAGRYSNDCRKADDALKVREAFGLDRWQELAQNDNTVVAKTRLKWTEAEVQRQGKSQDCAQNAAPLEARREPNLEAAARAGADSRTEAGAEASVKGRHAARCEPEICRGLLRESGSAAGTYHFVGDSNDWKKPPRPMALRMSSAGARQLVHRVKLENRKGRDLLGPAVRREEFQILRDGNWDRRLYPRTNRPGPDIVLLWAGGPSSPAAAGEKKEQGHGRNWALEGQVGDVIDVVYDLSEEAVWIEEVT